MIAANELRTGNWLQYVQELSPHLDGYVIVHEILNGNHEFGKGINRLNKESYWLPGFEQYEGISLTPEILEKAGFKDFYGDGVFYFDGFHYKTESMNLWFDSSSIEIGYLHQLQNLYFALTGEELKIEL